jgi:hypothetical protein
MQYQVSPFEHYLYHSSNADEPAIHGGFSLQASARSSNKDSEDKHSGGGAEDHSTLSKFQSHIVPAGLVVVESSNPISYHNPKVIDGGVISEKLFNDLFESVAYIQSTKSRKLTKKKHR